LVRTRATLDQAMVCVVLAEDEVAAAVIVPDAVHVVDFVTGVEVAADCALSDQHVFRHVPAHVRARVVRTMNSHVAVGHVHASAVPPVMAPASGHRCMASYVAHGLALNVSSPAAGLLGN
jgi:hypothetical protein